MRQTRQEIQKAFLNLARQKSIDKVTVREIVEECGINRNSFYYHFEDIPDLIESILEDLFSSKYVKLLDENPKNAFLAIAQDLENNMDLCRNFYYSRGRDALEIRFARLFKSIVLNYLNKEQFSQYTISDEDRQIIAAAYHAELVGLMFEWIRAGQSQGLTVRFARLYDLRQGTLKRMLERADQSTQTDQTGK